MEAVRAEGPGVRPHQTVVVHVHDVDGTRCANGQRHSLHRHRFGQATRDERYGAVKPHALFDDHRQVVHLGQISPGNQRDNIFNNISTLSIKKSNQIVGKLFLTHLLLPVDHV